MLIIELPSYYQANQPTAEIVASWWNLDFFTGFSTVFFAFQCQVQLLPIYSELVDPEYRRISKVIDRAIVVDFMFYLIIASAGYLSTFDETAKIVLERATLDGKPDIPCLIAVFGVMLSITVAFPCGYNPARSQMANLFFGRDTFSDKENLLMTATWMLITWGISVVYPKIDKVLAIMGGLCASTLDYGIPMYCFVKLSEKPWTSPKNLAAIIVFGAMTLIGYTSVGITIFEWIVGVTTMREYDKCGRGGCPDTPAS